MHECALSSKPTGKITQPRGYLDQYASVEISNTSIDFSYHFKLWNVASAPMCILIKEDSQILSQLKEGDTFNMKYYTCDALSPAEFKETAIRHITKDNKGRFKGHYVVQLEILENQEAKKSH